MWWIKDITVTKGTTSATYIEEVARLSLGTIERGLIYFPPGCQGLVRVTLWRWEHQFLPENVGGYIKGDDYVYDLPMDYEIEQHPAEVIVRAWNIGAEYDHTIMVGIFLREARRPSLSEWVKTHLGYSP